MPSFLDIRDVDSSQLRAILNAALARKGARKDAPFKGQMDADQPLADQTLAMIFTKSSTRTRISFEMAIKQLGGSALVLDGDSMQLGRGETVEDTAHVMARYVDAIMIRTSDHDDVIALAKYSGLPVINGLTDRSHPCQIMADLMTFEEHRGRIDGAKVAWIGDGNNVARSFAEAAAKLNFSLTMASPEGYQMDRQTLDWCAENGQTVALTTDPQAAVQGADLVVTDTWVSMGDADADARTAALTPYQVNEDLMAMADPNALFMHCLPAHRGEEVTDAVMDGSQSVVFDEAENRLHAQKAILCWSMLGTI